MIDANEGATDQDAAIGGEADRAGRGIVIVANKWDLVKSRGPHVRARRSTTKLRRGMRFLDYAPILHISALTGERTPQGARDDRQGGGRAAQARPDAGAEQVHRVGDRREPAGQPRAASTSGSCTRRRSASRRRRSSSSPTSRRRFIFPTSASSINQLREKFGFVGTPIRIQVRRRDRNANVGGDRKSRGVRPDQKESRSREVQKERKDRRARKNRRDLKER